MSLKDSIRKLSALKDLHLIWRAKEGDSEAYAKLYLKYADALFRYVFFRTKQNKELSEDIIQETFIKSWQNIKNFSQTKGTYQAWIYKIARNLTIDELRKNGKYTRLNPNTHDPKADMQEKLFINGEYQSLMSGIRRLPPIQREVVVLRFINEMSHSEVSKILGKGQGSIRAIQYRALKKLKKNHEKHQ